MSEQHIYTVIRRDPPKKRITPRHEVEHTKEL